MRRPVSNANTVPIRHFSRPMQCSQGYASYVEEWRGALVEARHRAANNLLRAAARHAVLTDQLRDLDTATDGRARTEEEQDRHDRLRARLLEERHRHAEAQRRLHALTARLRERPAATSVATNG